MEIKDIDTYNLLKEIERRDIVRDSKKMSDGIIEDGQWNVIDFNFLLLNSELTDDEELVVKVDDIILYGSSAYNAEYEHNETEGLEEVYIFHSYSSMMSKMNKTSALTN